MPLICMASILQISLTVVRTCVSAYEWEVTESHWSELKSLFSWHRWTWMLQLTWLAMALSELLQKAQLDWSVCFYIRWPGVHKWVTFWSRCYPPMLSRRRRFYSKRPLLRALASKDATHVTSFLDSWLSRMCTSCACWPWSCRATTYILWFVLMAYWDTGDGRERHHRLLWECHQVKDGSNKITKAHRYLLSGLRYTDDASSTRVSGYWTTD